MSTDRPGGAADSRGGGNEAARPARHCGFVAMVGAPNVGKSTLVNRLVGRKVSIVSPRSQTTRTIVRGIVVDGGTQAVLVDTPGLFTPKRLLDRAMLSAAWRSVDDADVVALLIDAAHSVGDVAGQVIERLQRRQCPAYLILNKIDLVDKPTLLPLIERFAAAGTFDRVFMISALTGDGIVALLQALLAAMPPGPWLYPDAQLTDMPEPLQAAEITREQLFRQLQEELPRSTAVVPLAWQPRPDGSLRIEQRIYVERDSQKGIVIGDGGRRIRAIGIAARLELERLLECRVHLLLDVEVRVRWADRREGFAWHRLDPPADG